MASSRGRCQSLIRSCLVLSVLAAAHASTLANRHCTANGPCGVNTTHTARAAAAASAPVDTHDDLDVALPPAEADAVLPPPNVMAAGLQRGSSDSPESAEAAAERLEGAASAQAQQQEQQQAQRRQLLEQRREHTRSILDAAAEALPSRPGTAPRGNHVEYLLFVSEPEQLPRHLNDTLFTPIVAPVTPPRLRAGLQQDQQQHHNEHQHQHWHHPNPHHTYHHHELGPAGDVMALLARERPSFMVSVGDESHFEFLESLPAQFRATWFHVDAPSALTASAIEAFYMAALRVPANGTATEPLLSLFTPAYKSGWKIHIPYDSLLAQTYQNWEWVIYDDSPPSHTATWQELSALRDVDPRIKVLRTDRNDGYIGNVKAKACLAASGQLLLELDHDDELTPDTLELVKDAYLAHPDAGFLYGETTELYEGSTDTVDYGALFAVGWGVHFRMLHSGEWLTATYVPPPTEATLRHIVGVPNHIRVWRRDAYLAVGAHTRGLSVADDYDLILRAYFEYPSVYIRQMNYVQYRQKDGSTFTFKRNALIQRMVEIISKRQGRSINKLLTANNKTDTGRRARAHFHLVQRDTEPMGASLSHFYHKPSVMAPPDTPHVTVVIPTYNNTEGLMRAIQSVYAQDYAHWELLVMGDRCPLLDAFMEQHKQMFIDGNHTVRYYNMHPHTGLQEPLNAGVKALVGSDWMAYLTDNATWTPDHLASLAAVYAADKSRSYVFASVQHGNKVVEAREPREGVLASSAVMHHRRLIEDYGGWKGQEDGTGDAWELFSRWASEPWGASLKPTVVMGQAAAAAGEGAQHTGSHDEL